MEAQLRLWLSVELGRTSKCQAGLLGDRQNNGGIWRTWCLCTRSPSPGKSSALLALPMSLVQSGAPRPKHAHDKGCVPWQTFNKWTVRYIKSSLSWFLVLTDPRGISSLSSTKQEELVDKTCLLQRCVNPELGIKKLKSVIYIYLYIDIKIDDHTKTKKVKEISTSILYISLLFFLSYFCCCELFWKKMPLGCWNQLTPKAKR